MAEELTDQREYEARARFEDSLHTAFGLRNHEVFHLPDLDQFLFRAAFTTVMIELHEMLQRMDQCGDRFTQSVSVQHIRQFKDVTDLVCEFRNGLAHTHSAQSEIPLKSLPGYQQGRRFAIERSGDAHARPWAKLGLSILVPQPPGAIIEFSGLRMPDIPEGDVGIQLGGLTILVAGDIDPALLAAAEWFHRHWPQQ